MYELIFCGSLIQYWHKIRAECQRPSRKDPLAPEAFRLSHAHPPEEFEEVTIEFLDEQRRLGLVTVDALSGADGKMVKLLVHDQNAYKEPGKKALSRWKKLESAWIKKGWLIDPLAGYQAKKKRGMYRDEETGKKLELLREIRREYIHKYKEAPTNYYALTMARISRYRCEKYAPDLFKNWKDIDYE